MPSCTRREAMTTFAAAALGAAWPSRAWAEVTRPASRALDFAHLHTGERLTVEFCSDGQYVPDFRTGEIHDIDPALLDLLVDLRARTGSARPYDVISGFRSPATNAALRRHSRGVAAGSLHMQGKAIDIRVGGVPLGGLRRAALALGHGGVGYYPAANFVHVDTGRVRAW
jgi:uncharacterized protein YcbK (DUF882 family)